MGSRISATTRAAIEAASAEFAHDTEALSEFWLGALEADGDIEAGRKRVQRFRNEELGERIRAPRFESTDEALHPRHIDHCTPEDTLIAAEEPADDASEPDSAEQHHALYRCIARMHPDDQRLVRDHLIGGARQVDLGFSSQQNASGRLATILAGLKLLHEAVSLKPTRQDVERACVHLTRAQAQNLRALVAGRPFVMAVVRRAASRLDSRTRIVRWLNVVTSSAFTLTWAGKRKAQI